ncbi:rhomboid-like protein [Streptomyces sp. NPDC004111]|uniref:rhomboid-like protein n=1 Tax=Streptomyces sp. NPDC004111 TaxID=3364690 RepID=UPI003681582E
MDRAATKQRRTCRRQRTATAPEPLNAVPGRHPAATAASGPWGAPLTDTPTADAEAPGTATDAPAAPVSGTSPAGPAADAARTHPRTPPSAGRWHLWHLLPTPTGTPFTFCYALVLVATSLYAQLGDPATVSAALRASSTDVAHLTSRPVLALVGSALWVAGGLASPYALGFLVVLTALERRIGGLRTAGVFAFGHVVASLATELPVGIAVWAGHLPETSLHRLDFGISFGLMACVGALAGVLRLPWLRWGLLGVVGLVLLQDLVAYADPLTALGHPLALCLGLATWPLVRRWKARRAAPSYL